MLDHIGIKKANLTFKAKFFRLLVRYHLFLTAVDNILTWDRALLVASLVAGLEVKFTKLLISVIDERAFKTSTTYPFVCTIFHLCSDVGVHIWHHDDLRTLARTIDISLIWDEANVEALRKGPRVYLHPLSKNSADTVELTQGADPDTSHTTDTTLDEPVHGTSRESSSSWYTLPSPLVSIVSVHNLKDHMHTLLYYIQSCMQKSIVEAEDRIEKKGAPTDGSEDSGS